MRYLKRGGTTLLLAMWMCSGVLGAASRAVAAPVEEQPLKWQTNYVRAIQLAKKEDKLVLAYFRGSDWCPYCKKLDKDVMYTYTFERWAKKNVIPLEIDFPKNKRQPKSIVRQNDKLKEKYQVVNTPTFLFLDKDGREVARAGWDEAHLRKEESEGAPSTWMAYLRRVVSAGPDVESITLQPSLGEAIEFRAHKLPLLLLVTHDEQDRTARLRQTMLTEQNFVSFVKTNCAFIELAWPAGDDQSPEAAAARAFFTKHQIVDRPVQLVMWDSKRDAITARMTTINPARMDLLLGRLEKSLPEIPYKGEWISDYRLARAISSQTGRELFMCFTSYDSSEWCTKFKDEILGTDDFRNYARRNLVLLGLDFPTESEQTPELKKQNERLANLHAVRGFPTAVVFNSKGQKIGVTKYMRGGPGPFIVQLNDLIKKDRDRRTLLSDKYR